jgi:hypothetical protein
MVPLVDWHFNSVRVLRLIGYILLQSPARYHCPFLFDQQHITTNEPYYLTNRDGGKQSAMFTLWPES